MARRGGIKAACEFLGVKDTKVRKLIKNDPDFPAYWMGKWVIDLDKLPEYREKFRSGAKLNKQMAKPRRGRPPEKKKKTEQVYDVITPGWNRPVATSG